MHPHPRRIGAAWAVALVVAALVALAAPIRASAGPLDAALAPPNDNFASAQFIPSGSNTVTGSNVDATGQVGEPKHILNDAATDSSVWYRWTSPVSGRVIFRTKGSSFDTVLAAYTGDPTSGTGTQVGANDDTAGLQSQIQFTATAFQQYSIVVEGFTSSSDFVPKRGTVKLSWTVEDDFGAAPALPGPALPFQTAKIDNVGASKQAGEPNLGGTGDCCSVWFTWTAPFSGAARFSTVGGDLDTVLAVFTGNSVSALTPVAFNNDISSTNKKSQVVFSADKGVKYRIAVAGAGGTEGTSVLNYSLPGPTISIGDASITEGASGTKVLHLPVKLSRATDVNVKVSFATSNFTAIAPGDYVARSGSVTFLPDQTTKNVNITINGDTAKEFNEFFKVTLTAPTGGNATISDGLAQGGILNDDA